MTWSAHHIFAQPHPVLLSIVTRHPPLAHGVYWVRDLSDHPWPAPQLQHTLPESGLVVVRPIGPEEADEHAEWYPDWDVHLSSWNHGMTTADCILQLSPATVLAQLTDDPAPSRECYPPDALLRSLKALSQQAGATVAYYVCETWGGYPVELQTVIPKDITPHNEGELHESGTTIAARFSVSWVAHP